MARTGSTAGKNAGKTAGKSAGKNAGAKGKQASKPAQQEERKLEQTKGSFKLRGVVGALRDEMFQKEGIIEKGAYEGHEYKSTRFPVTTFVDENGTENTHYVELFGMEQDVYISKREGDKFTTKKIAFDKRTKLDKGWNMIGTRVKLNSPDEQLCQFDAVQRIQEELEEGTHVYVAGDLAYRTYEDRQGVSRLQKQFSIKSISKQSKDIDFEAEDFKEMASFEQQLVIVDVSKDAESNKIIVIGRVIAYNQTWEDVEFVIDPDYSSAVAKMAKAFMKLKFGDLVTVKGIVINRTIVEEMEDTESDDLMGEEVEGFGDAVTTRISELQILSGKKDEEKKYTEDDFLPQELVEDDKDQDDDEENEDDDLSGEKDEIDEDEDDDLPF